MDFMYPIAMLAKLYLYLYLMKTCRFYFDIEMNKVNCWHSQWLAVFFVFISQQVGQLNFANIFIGYKKKYFNQPNWNVGAVLLNLFSAKNAWRMM